MLNTRNLVGMPVEPTSASHVGPSPTAASAYLLASRDRRRDGQQNRGVRAEEPRHLLGNSTQLSTPCILPFALGRHYV
eukprot:scaffold89663_cov73-Phaeocystis_antarctica.AAC.1